jgi:anhydro-N-acetylmuramic acid kinase
VGGEGGTVTGLPLTVVGLISGTSVDGIDAAVVRIRDLEHGLGLELVGYRETPFDQELRRRISTLFRPEQSRVDDLCEVNVLIGEAFADSAAAALREVGTTPDVIASHGQTVWHEVAPGRTRSTLQIGEPSVIAERLGVTVVADFRPRDVAAGGQGAPLASYVDVLLFGGDGRPRAIQNIGGISNVTWVPGEGDRDEILAFDTGPGNMLIDYAAGQLTNGEQNYDVDGRLAAAGTPDERLLDALLIEPYLDLPPPKTTGRELFGAQLGEQFLEHARARGLAPTDILATLTAFTARSIADQYRRFLPSRPDEVVISGGGSKNPTMMRMLREQLAPSTVRTQGEFGLPDAGREAAYFAVLGYQALHGRANTLPRCTGADHPVAMGKILPGRNYRALARRVASAPELDARRLVIERTGRP